MEEVIIRFRTTNGLEQSRVLSVHESALNLDLRNIAEIDLLPLVWCSKLERLSIRYNHLVEIDLSPLSKCVSLEVLHLNHNELVKVDLHPLSDCPHLREVDLRNNHLSSVDISPLFHCSELETLLLDDDVTLTADLLLRSIGSWPDVLVGLFHRILWKSSHM